MTEGELRIERVDAASLHALRRRVLRGDDPDKTVEDPRDDDASALHYGGLLGERIVVCASFYPSTSPTDEQLTTYHLRYMATDFDVQRRGYGAALMARALADLADLGVEQVWANGRDTALGFYRATGWDVIDGSQHLSPETSLPHTKIVRRVGDVAEV